MKAAAGTAIATAAAEGTAPAFARPAVAGAPGRPKVGCVSWCFHSFDGGADPEEAIGIMGEIGFEGTDLILLAREDTTRTSTGCAGCWTSTGWRWRSSSSSSR